MKPYLIGLLILILPMAMANSQDAIKADHSIRVTSNMSEKTEEYLNPSVPIKVKTGQRFTIRMESNPTTGYSWQISKALDNKIILVTNAYIPPDSKLIGAGGHELWTFKAIAEGQTDIAMKYIRPWEQDQPARTNVFTVIVK